MNNNLDLLQTLPNKTISLCLKVAFYHKPHTTIYLPVSSDTQFSFIKTLLCEILADPTLTPDSLVLYPRLTLQETINLHVLQMEQKRQIQERDINFNLREICDEEYPEYKSIALGHHEIEPPKIEPLEDTFTPIDYGFNVVDSIIVHIIKNK